ncbi:MAG: hypothetical protein O7D86_12745 [Proteobacteria bacterium]|nr:hypothetical protein [Pseudomonadota bacterium]
MLRVDEFESVFRSAIKERYQHQEITIKSVLLVTDLDAGETERLLSQVKDFCKHLGHSQNINWHTASQDDFKSAEDLFALINRSSIDLIVTYRNLHSETWQHPFSLGEHLDVMSQKTRIPVLVIPHPKAGYARDNSLVSCNSVMVVSDLMVNDHHLVQYGLAFIEEQGRFYISHIEDQSNFDRVIEAISKIPTIDTEDAKQKLGKQLLKEPADYIQSVKTELDKLNRPPEVTAVIEFGHPLKDYLKHIDEKQINLLVINTKDGDQMAMHGLAYPLAVEVRQIPLLML